MNSKKTIREFVLLEKSTPRKKTVNLSKMFKIKLKVRKLNYSIGRGITSEP